MESARATQEAHLFFTKRQYIENAVATQQRQQGANCEAGADGDLFGKGKWKLEVLEVVATDKNCQPFLLPLPEGWALRQSESYTLALASLVRRVDGILWQLAVPLPCRGVGLGGRVLLLFHAHSRTWRINRDTNIVFMLQERFKLPLTEKF